LPQPIERQDFHKRLQECGRGERRLGAVDDETPQARAEHFRGVAAQLRTLADQIRYDFRRRNQLLALADGFERFADRLQQQEVN
jgi:hypothetical protein